MGHGAIPEEPLSHLLLFAKAPALCKLPKPQRRPCCMPLPPSRSKMRVGQASVHGEEASLMVAQITQQLEDRGGDGALTPPTHTSD